MGKLAAAVCVGAMEAERGSGDPGDPGELLLLPPGGCGGYFNSFTPPCFVCGFGDTCQYGAPAMMMSPEEFGRFKMTPEMFRRFEDQPEVVEACESLSRDLAQALRSR